MDIPEEESEKMIFLIEVSIARCITPEDPVWDVWMGLGALRTSFSFCPLCSRKGPGLMDRGQDGAGCRGWTVSLPFDAL